MRPVGATMLSSRGHARGRPRVGALPRMCPTQGRRSRAARAGHTLVVVLVGISALTAVVETAYAEQAPAPNAAGPADAAGSVGSASDPTRYEVLLSSDGPSTDVLYDLGTAYAERGDVGKALWALERARLASPSDADVAHNLEVVRQRVRRGRMEKRRAGRMTEGEPDGVSTFRTVTAVTAGALAWPSLVAWIAAFALLFWHRRLVAGGIKDAVTVGVVVLFVAAALGFGGLAARTATLDTVEVGIAVQKSPMFRRAPIVSEKRGAHPDLFEGATVRVLERRADGWIHVELVDETRGWMQKDAVGLVF